MRPSISGLAFKWKCLTTLEGGQNLVEYGLVVALVAFGCAATMKSFAAGINTEFSTVISVISSAMA
jgi:Flp pilus assembly pilin Flp